MIVAHMIKAATKDAQLLQQHTDSKQEIQNPPCYWCTKARNSPANWHSKCQKIYNLLI